MSSDEALPSDKSKRKSRICPDEYSGISSDEADDEDTTAFLQQTWMVHSFPCRTRRLCRIQPEKLGQILGWDLETDFAIITHSSRKRKYLDSSHQLQFTRLQVFQHERQTAEILVLRDLLFARGKQVSYQPIVSWLEKEYNARARKLKFSSLHLATAMEQWIEQTTTLTLQFNVPTDKIDALTMTIPPTSLKQFRKAIQGDVLKGLHAFVHKEFGMRLEKFPLIKISCGGIANLGHDGRCRPENIRETIKVLFKLIEMQNTDIVEDSKREKTNEAAAG